MDARKKPGPSNRNRAALAIMLPALLLMACAPSRPGAALSRVEVIQVKLNLDSIDEAYAFKDYQAHFPGVREEIYKGLARGKPRSFCLFMDDPVATCAEIGDFLNDRGMKKDALEAYRAAELSSGYNKPEMNIKLWGSLAQLAIEGKDWQGAQQYLARILSVDEGNSWAKKRLTEIFASRYE